MGIQPRYQYDLDGIKRMIENGHSKDEIARYYCIPYCSMRAYIMKHITGVDAIKRNKGKFSNYDMSKYHIMTKEEIKEALQYNQMCRNINN